MWALIIGSVLVVLCVSIFLFLLWFNNNNNWSRLVLNQNEKACSLAIKAAASPAIAWIHPDSEHGILLKRLNDLTIISQKKREELLGLLLSQNKERLKAATSELREVTSEMIAIMEEVIDDPLEHIRLAQKLAKLNKK